MGEERGQGTVEWAGTLLCVSLLLAGLIAVGVRVPGGELGRSVVSRVLCAASLAEGCGDEPVLIAEYGSEVGTLVREHMPILAFEKGSRAVPVDFRRCRSTVCGDAPGHGVIWRTERDLPVTAFVHVIDCRPGGAGGGVDCSGAREGNLYLQYWLYYADSATLRDIPIVGDEGFHKDDWEGVQIRIDEDGEVAERASSHNGYNYVRGAANWASDAGLDPVNGAAEEVGAREANGWGPESHLLLISGGSHAGNVVGMPDSDRYTPGRRVHLIPLEPIVAGDQTTFAISPPWRKQVWRDPEASGTG